MTSSVTFLSSLLAKANNKATIIAALLAAIISAYLLLRLRRRRHRQPVKGRVVLVTGASSGIGEALARELVRRGAKVILAARRTDRLRQITESIAQPSNTRTCELDISQLDQLAEKADELWQQFGRIDILLHNAGVTLRSSALETPRNLVERIFRVNYLGPIELNRHLLPRMLSGSGSGSPTHLAVISSLQGLFAPPYRSTYSASKHALQAYCDSLRAEEHKRLLVSVISPGWVRTELSRSALLADGSTPGVDNERILAGYSAEYVAKRSVDALEAAEEDVIVSQMRLVALVYLRCNWPSLFHCIMRWGSGELKKLGEKPAGGEKESSDEKKLTCIHV